MGADRGPRGRAPARWGENPRPPANARARAASPAPTSFRPGRTRPLAANAHASGHISRLAPRRDQGRNLRLDGLLVHGLVGPAWATAAGLPPQATPAPPST